jgi:hypothetical protein
MSLPEGHNTTEEASSPIVMKHLCFAIPPVTPNPKKGDGGGDRFIDGELFVDEMKLSSMTVPYEMFTQKMYFNNGEHTLIPVTAKMIHSAVSICNKFVLRDGRPLNMVNLVGAVRNNHENTKNIMIDGED